MAVRISLFGAAFLAACSSAPAMDGGSDGVESDTGEVLQAARVPVAKFVAAGDTMSCARIGGQGVKCWGGNSSGELGIGSTGGEYPAPQSIVDPGARVKSMAASSLYNCAVLKEGEVKCWGQGVFGTLGTGDRTSLNAPGPAVALPAPAREVESRGLFVCARLEGGAVYCWGDNYQGQLGIGAGDSTVAPTAPVDFGGRKAAGLATGVDHACALLGNGTVRCWGNNWWGKLGDGTSLDSPTPAAPVALGAKAVQISAGNAHTCALLETGAISCWGSNYDGQMGIGERTEGGNPPRPVVGLPGPAVSVAAGGDHTCAVLADGRAACWGINYSGQVGSPDYELQHASPVILDIDFSVAEIDAGFDHTCALSTTGQVKCWGANWYGKLGLACYPGCMDTWGQSPSQIPNVAF